MRLALTAIVFDAGTQIRAAISEQVVTEYAERMSEGVQFPPVVLFHDGNRYYMADGFHRALAGKRVGFTEIDADVHPGTQQDALWFALGANKANGQRLTEADKRHALSIAFTQWPERSARSVAEQVGCSSTYATRIRDEVQTSAQPVDRVTGTDGRSYPASRTARQKMREKAEQMLAEGHSTAEVQKAVGIGRDSLLDMRRSLGLSIDKSRKSVQERREQMRAMAADGHTSRQIAATLGISEEGCRDILRKEGIDVPADKVTRGTHRHDSNRIMERIVMDAENLTEGVNFIEFDSLDGAQIQTWLASLKSSRDKLSAFIRRLMEAQKHVEVA